MNLIFDFLFLGLLSTAALTDFKCSVVPNIVPFLIGLLAVINSILNKNLGTTIFLLFFIATILLLIAVLGKVQVGGGDIKLISAVFAYLGVIDGAVAIFIASIIALLYIKIKKVKSTFFATFIFYGCLTMCFFKLTYY